MKHILILLILCGSCNQSAEKNQHQDSLAAADSLFQLLQIKKDTFLRVVDLVESIRSQKANSELIPKGTDEILDAEGGYVHGYYYNDTTIAYLYTSLKTAYGRDQTESFFDNNQIVYSVFRYLYFMPGSNQIETTLKAEKIFYFPGAELSKDTISRFNEEVRQELKFSDKEFKRNDLPTATEMAARTFRIKNNLEKRENKTILNK